MISKKITPGAVRPLTGASPEYAVSSAKVQEMRALHSKLQKERTDLWDLVGSGTDDGDNEVAVLLGGEPNPAVQSKDQARLRLSEIATEIETVNKAMKIAEGNLRSARLAASAVIVDEVRPTYREKVRAVADALKGLLAAHIGYRDLVAELNGADIAWSALRPLGIERIVGDPRDRHGIVAQWFREAAEYGYVTPAEIPAAFR